jgi:protein gp37
LVPEKLTEPFTWRSPKLVFVNSMSDLFQPGVADGYAEAVSQVMVKANWHTYQVLTKRSERLRDLLNGRLKFAAQQKHIWWGVSVEDRKYGLPRIDHLQESPAAIRFLSVEPLLEDLGELDLTGISWVISRRRKRSPVRVQSKKNGFFQFASSVKLPRVPSWGGKRKSLNGRSLEGRTFDEYPQRALISVPEKAECLERAKAFASSTRKTFSFVQLRHAPA